MNVESVQNYLNHIICRSTLSSIIKKICPIHEHESYIFYNTSDIKSVMMPDLFREMECHVTTHMVIKK
jgi:hypothetical protein